MHLEGKGGYYNFHLSAELTVPPQAAGVVGTLKSCVFSLHIISVYYMYYVLISFTLRMPYYFYNVSFCMCTLPLF